MDNYFALRLKYLRRSANMTQTALAKQIGKSKVSINGYENGSRIPSLDTLFLICKLFNVSFDFITGINYELNINEDYAKDEFLLKIIKRNDLVYHYLLENPRVHIDKIQSMIEKDYLLK